MKWISSKFFPSNWFLSSSFNRFWRQRHSVVLRFSKMKTVTNLYILNLAFADEIFLIGLPILIFTMHIGEWMFGVFFCKLYMISTSITQFTSSIFLVIMSADRWVVIVHLKFSNLIFVMSFQIYRCLPSHQFATFPHAARLQSRVGNRVVHLGRPHAAAHHVFHDNSATRWGQDLQHYVAFDGSGNVRGSERLIRRGGFVHQRSGRRLDVHALHVHTRLCHSAVSHPHFLLSGTAEAANSWTENQVKGEKAVA
jgi:hypothetical protein